jgi:hypothetical protein
VTTDIALNLWVKLIKEVVINDILLFEQNGSKPEKPDTYSLFVMDCGPYHFTCKQQQDVTV